MQAYRPDRVVRVMTTLVSIAYFGLWFLGAIALTGALAVKLLVVNDPEWIIGLPVQAVVRGPDTTVLMRWGEASLEVEDVRGSLRLPISLLPAWLFAIVWSHVAVAFALMLRFLHHLRRIFQRVRDGAPFDHENALRLRWLGLLLLALAVLNGIAESVTSVAVRNSVVSGSVTVPTGLHLDMTLVLAALVLLSLAEIFRRGAELEDEQSLVI